MALTELDQLDMYGNKAEAPPTPLDYQTEQRMYAVGWRKGMPPSDPNDGVKPHCQFRMPSPGNSFRPCTWTAGHAGSHWVVYVGQERWFLEVTA